MSTKIYYGLRLKNPEALVEMPQALNHLLDPIRTRLEIQVAYIYALEAWKKHSENPEEFPEPRWTSLLLDVSKKFDEAKESQIRNPFDGLEFSLTFLPTPGGQVLAMPFFQRNNYYDALLKTGWFEDFGYWDNTDQPEDVTDEQWLERRYLWEQALGKTWVPKRSGLTFEHEPMWPIFIEAPNWDPAVVAEVIAEAHGDREITPAVQRVIDWFTAGPKKGAL